MAPSSYSNHFYRKYSTEPVVTIIKHIDKSHMVHIIDLTFGETGELAQYWNSTANPNVEDCKKIRRNEAEKAAAVMGATIEFMDYDDYPLIIYSWKN